MRVLVKQPEVAGEDVVLPLDRLRDRLEECLLTALESWEVEKKNLEQMVARAEAKEQEFRKVADDVKKRLDALDLVTDMVREVESERPAPVVKPEPRPILAPALKKPSFAENMAESAPDDEKPAAEPRLFDLPFRTSSRPLFTAEQRARAGVLSILP